MALQINFSDFAETKLKFINRLTYGRNQVQSDSGDNKSSLFEHCSDLQIKS